MALFIPNFCKLDEDITYDDSVNKTNLIRKDPTSGKETSALNGSSPITFELESNNILRLGSPRSGIEFEYEYRTKSGNPLANDENANITLANASILYLFNRARLRFGDEDIEDINHLAIVTDIINQLKGENFRNNFGEISGFIPDEGDGKARRFPVTGSVTMAAAGTNANLVLNYPYNSIYNRRFDRYNYDVPNNDTFRYNREFHPFSELFGFCDYYDRVLKYLKMSVELERNERYNNAVFGVENTAMEIRITNITFQIEEIILNDDLKNIINKRFEDTIERPLTISFLKRKCESKKCDVADCHFSFTKFSCPRYVFVCAKKYYNGDHSGVTDNYQLYCHADIKEVIISIDDQLYPDKSQNTRFNRNQYTALYQSFSDCCRALGGACGINSKEYKELFPIIAIDCCNQPRKLPGSVTNLQISIKRNEVPADNTNLNNPRELTYFVIILDEALYSFDLINKKLKKLRGHDK
jgi:hypothetical protein